MTDTRRDAAPAKRQGRKQTKRTAKRTPTALSMRMRDSNLYALEKLADAIDEI
jgi:hypothetical protein